MYVETEADQFAAVHRVLAEKATDLGFIECFLVVGGDHGFHTECRLLRNRIGDWRYELDCHEQPNQSMLIAEPEVTPLTEMIRDLAGRHSPEHPGIVKGPDASVRVPCIWYHAGADRRVLVLHTRHYGLPQPYSRQNRRIPFF